MVVSGQGNQAKPLWYWCSVIISLTPLFSMILYSAEISFSQAQPGIEPATRRPIVTLNRRCLPELRHKGGAFEEIYNNKIKAVDEESQDEKQKRAYFSKLPILNKFSRKFHGLVLGSVELIGAKQASAKVTDVAQPIQL